MKQYFEQLLGITLMEYIQNHISPRVYPLVYLKYFSIRKTLQRTCFTNTHTQTYITLGHWSNFWLEETPSVNKRVVPCCIFWHAKKLYIINIFKLISLDISIPHRIITPITAIKVSITFKNSLPLSLWLLLLLLLLLLLFCNKNI